MSAHYVENQNDMNSIKNWTEIKKKYPKSMIKLYKWLGIEEYKSSENPEWGTLWFQFKNEILHVNDGFIWNVRNLLDFFDEQGIVFNGGFFFGSGGNEYGWGFIVMEKLCKDFALISPDQNEIKLYGNLKEAEKQSWMKAFEILEDREKNQT